MLKKILLIINIIFLSIIGISQENIIAKNGVIDLTNFNFQKKNAELEGEWEFYWHKLYTPKDFKDKVHTPDAYLKVPNSWTSIKTNQVDITDTGYATIRLVLFFSDTVDGHFSLLIPEVVSAYKVWFNGKSLTQLGTVGRNSKEAKSDVRFTINSIHLKSKKNELIIQISNFDHRSPAFAESPIIGYTQNVTKKFSSRVAINLITFGLMLIMSFYHFGLFFMRTKNISALSFAILTLILAIRNITTDTYTFQFLFPNTFSWQQSYLIAYSSFFTFIAAFTFFFQVTFKLKKFRFIYYLSYGTSLIFLTTLFLPSIIYSKLLKYYQLFVIFLIFALVYLLIKLVREKRKGAKIFLISFIILALTGIHDIGTYMKFYYSVPLLQFGVMALILGQALTLAQIFTDTFKENEQLSETLNYQNENLQNIVKDRTKEIEQQKQDILLKNEELLVQKEELQSQKDAILNQKKIIEEHSQLINESIYYASSIQKSILPSTQKLNLYFEHFIVFLPKDVVSGDFYWFSDNHKDFILLAVGDCTGHGVPGAFLSLISSYLLNNIVNEKSKTDTKEILQILEIKFNKFLNKQSKKSIDGMDITILRFNKKNDNKVLFSGAKGNVIIVDSEKKELVRYKGDRKSIGYINNNPNNNVNFTSTEITINKNSLLYCYSDGYVDQNNKSRKRFGTKHFMEILTDIVDRPIQQQKLVLLKELENWQQNTPQRDDITIIGFKLR